MRLAYPRLSEADALVRMHAVNELALTSPDKLSTLAGFAHPNAQPVPTGAEVATPERISKVRDQVMNAVQAFINDSRVQARETAVFDVTLGRALHEALEILPSDAAHRATWNFLSAVVFPDVVWARFPEPHEERFLGHPRNALRRVWTRYEVLGVMLLKGDPGLREDELVQLFERTALARNRRLVRTLAQAVLSFSGTTSRMEFARDLAKRTTHVTGPMLLDTMSHQDLERLVDCLVSGEPWALPPAPEADPSVRTEPVERHAYRRGGAATPASVDGTAALRPIRSSGDLVRQFHKEMQGIYTRTLSETGYKASKFFNLVDDLGGIEAARRLVGAPNPSEGFTVLWELGRLDLTVEALMLRPEFRGLFTRELLERAQSRLGDHGFDAH